MPSSACTSPCRPFFFNDPATTEIYTLSLHDALPIFGPLGNPGGSGIDVFSKFLSSAIGLLTIIAFIWFIFLFLTGAIGIMTAGGDKAALENARKRIINGLIGLIVVVAAMSIISLIGFIL